MDSLSLHNQRQKSNSARPVLARAHEQFSRDWGLSSTYLICSASYSDSFLPLSALFLWIHVESAFKFFCDNGMKAQIYIKSPRFLYYLYSQCVWRLGIANNIQRYFSYFRRRQKSKMSHLSWNFCNSKITLSY